MQVEYTDFTVGSDYMLSRFVVSLIILNICGVRLLCLWLQCILFLEKPVTYGFMLV